MKITIESTTRTSPKPIEIAGRVKWFDISKGL
jgi:hypothetical protein